MVWVREDAGLEDGGKVLRVHAVDVGLGGKDGEQVEDVEQQLTVERWQLCDEVLVLGDGGAHVEAVHKLRPVGVDNKGLLDCMAEGLAEALIKVEWDNRLGQIVQVPAQNVGCIVHCVARPR